MERDTQTALDIAQSFLLPVPIRVRSYIDISGQMFIFLLVLVLFCSTVHCQELPDAPMPIQAKTFWISAGLYAASLPFDGETTIHGIHQGCFEVGSAWLYGRRPTRLSFYGPTIAIGAGAILATKYLGHSHNRTVSKLAMFAGTAFLSYQAEEHFRGGIHNLRLNVKEVCQ
jgi:hypothetical protein